MLNFYSIQFHHLNFDLAALGIISVYIIVFMREISTFHPEVIPVELEIVNAIRILFVSSLGWAAVCVSVAAPLSEV